MGLIKRGNVWWYRFNFEGRPIQESAKTNNKKLAQQAEEDRRRELRDGLMGYVDVRKERAKTIAIVGEKYADDYEATHESSGFVTHSVRHLSEHLGRKMIAQIDVGAVSDYQIARHKEGASGSTINKEVGILLRMIGEPGDVLRGKLRRTKKLTVRQRDDVGRKFAMQEQDRLLDATKVSKSPHIHFAMQIALAAGPRSKEIRTLKWERIDFVNNILIIGKSKTPSSSWRRIPMTGELLAAFLEHREWYLRTFSKLKPEWYIFPGGNLGQMDPTKHVTTLKTAWTTARWKAGVVGGRFHDTRHTVITQLQEDGASAQTTMAIVGHVDPRMLKRYSHIGIEAQREALEIMEAQRERRREKEKQTQEMLSRQTRETKRENLRAKELAAAKQLRDAVMPSKAVN
jgi:integrase